ncbi:phage major capsid protein [Streptomyces sp. Y1]|uniref:Phage major capsid protein n=1 Tax=Streptomyces sp. Y1 TaxID=3238634 RepID=A0AB39TJP0_9ACTN
MPPTLEEQRTALLARLDDTSLTTEQVHEIVAEARGLADAIQAESDRAAARAALLRTAPAAPATSAVPDGGAPLTPAEAGTFRSLAQRFADSDGLREYRARDKRGQFQVEMRDINPNQLLSRDAPAGTITNPNVPHLPQLVPGIVKTTPDLPLLVADLLDQQNADYNVLEYIRETSGPAGAGSTWNKAAVVPEGTAKPQSTLTFDTITTTLKTVAHWMPITRQAADDNGQLTGYIQGRLTYGLRFLRDRQLLNGNGTTEMQGILTTPGIGTYQQPKPTAPATDEPPLVDIRRAKTVAEIAGFPPDGVIVHPQDWEAIELDQAPGSGVFRVIANVQGEATPRVWGLNVVSTVAIAQGTALVGGFRQGATLWSRQGITVLMTDSHADFFTANTLVILAEFRANLAVYQPKAFVKVTFAAATV